MSNEQFSEIPGNGQPSNAACQNLIVRGSLNVNGVPITGSGGAVTTDGTLTGDGSVSTPLSVVNAPAGSTAIATDATLTGNGQTGTPLSVVSVAGPTVLTPVISPAALAAGSTQDYAPTGLATAKRLRVTTDASAGSLLGGLVAQPDGTEIVVQNLGPQNLELTNEDAGSTAANRFAYFPNPGAVITAGGSATIVYDATLARWKVTAFQSELVAGSEVVTNLLRIQGSISPAVLAVGVTNDYSPAGLAATGRVRQATDAGASQLSGLIGLSDGSLVTFENLGPGALVILHENVGSVAGNRFTCPGGLSLVVEPGGSLGLLYDSTSLRWRPQVVAGGLLTTDFLVVGGPFAALGITTTDQLVTGNMRFRDTISPAALAAGATNDYAPAGIASVSRARLGADVAGSSLTGLAANQGGWILSLFNLGPGSLTLNNQNAGSAAANRFALPGGVDIVLAPFGATMLVYDATMQNWVLFGA